MSKSKAHIRYKNEEGNRVPGVTTVLGILNKPALIKWANNMGLKGIDTTKYVDDKADIGTLAHHLIICHLSGEEPDTSDYSKNQINQAENCILSFFEWEKSHPLKPLIMETPCVSELYQFGGTPDIYASLVGDSCNVLIDIKTGKGIYEEHGYQLAAYKMLLEENGHFIGKAIIVSVGRDENEEFQTKTFTDLDIEEAIFLNALKIYKLKKKKK